MSLSSTLETASRDSSLLYVATSKSVSGPEWTPDLQQHWAGSSADWRLMNEWTNNDIIASLVEQNKILASRVWGTELRIGNVSD